MALGYLLSPTFEIVNSAGKPATGGYIEVYVAGSRTKYFCASDFEGTRHPFRIPLDSLGSNVVLADDSGSYDVYVYNRYGTLLMSRYNVHPGEGGGLGGGTITSSDGSIIVTPTANGNDLKVNVGEPSVLRAGADTIYSSGPFVFSELVREGDKVWVDNSGKIRCRVGWYHYDITVRITWAPESPRNETIPVQLYTTLASNLTDFDASYTHDNTIRLSGETKIVENGAELAFGVLGLRNGLGAELIDMGVHAICIGTAGQSDLSAGTGIVIDQGEISVDPVYMSGYATQAELTYGLAGKQDVISDLSTIRSGAAAGASAVQPSDLATVATTGDYDDLSDKPDLSVYATTSAMNTALAGKQDTISDLSQIRAGAAAGSSAVQPNDLATVATTGSYNDLNNLPNLTVYATKTEVTDGLATKQDVISDLSTIRSGAAAGASAVQPSDLATVATTGDYDDLSDKPDLSVYATTSAMNTALAGKQDVISDLAQIRAGATAGSSAVQPADLARVATTGSYDDLNNRPNLTVYATKTEVTDGLATKQDVISDLSTIRSGAAAGATALQPADVATVATTGDYDDLIDKPDLSVYATTSAMNTALAGKQDTISDLATIRSGAAEGATAVQPADLATVATTGSYDDLSDKPTIPAAQVNSDWNASSGVAEILNKPQLSTVATTGDYDDLVNKPSIPAAQVNSDWNASSGVAEILNKPSLAAVATSGSYSDLSGAPTLATVATSGDYDDLTNKPSIPAAQVNSDWNASSGVAEILNKPTLATVATSGSYNDLTDKPSIPSAQVNADWNSSSGVSEILNKPTLATVATTGAYSDLSGTPTINNVPAVTSNDDSKVLKASYSGGVGSYSWEAESGGTVTDVEVDGTSVVSGGVASITMPTELVPTVTSNDDGKVLKATYSGGAGSYSWEAESGGTVTDVEVNGSSVVSGGVASITIPAQVNADWNSVSGASEILNKPTIPSGAQLVPAATSADEDKVLTVDSQGTPTWASAQAPISAGTGIDITNNVVSVDTTVVATQTDLAGKEDAFDVGTGLEMDTTGATPTLQVEAPVDIVAGPGIVVDNPDGNTLRVSMAQDVENVLFDSAIPSLNNTMTLSESMFNFEYVEVYFYNPTTGDNPICYRYPTALLNTSKIAFKVGWAVNYMTEAWLKFTPTNDVKVWRYVNNTVIQYRHNTTTLTIFQDDSTYLKSPAKLRVVGIHRIAGGN